MVWASGRIAGDTLQEYDARSQLTRIVFPDGRWVEYGYDLNGNRSLLNTAQQDVISNTMICIG